MALTDLSIKKLPVPETGQKTYFDTTVPGFGVRVSKGGSRSFILMYREHGRQKLKTIGRFGIVSLSDARTEARKVLANLTLGKATATPRRRPMTVSEAIPLFDRFHCQKHNRPSTRTETMRLLTVHLESLKSRQLSEVATSDIADILDGLTDTPGTALHVYLAASKFFNWCATRDYIGASPVSRLDPPAKPGRRDRVLSDDELKAIWAHTSITRSARSCGC